MRVPIFLCDDYTVFSTFQLLLTLHVVTIDRQQLMRGSSSYCCMVCLVRVHVAVEVEPDQELPDSRPLALVALAGVERLVELRKSLREPARELLHQRRL